MERRPGDGLLGKKVVAALLVALYAAVVFSASPEWVAWQGPLVVGSLDVQTTDSGFPSPTDDPGGAEGLLWLLAFLSAGAALLLTSRRLGLGEVSSPEDRAERGTPRRPTEATPGDPEGTGGAERIDPPGRRA